MNISELEKISEEIDYLTQQTDIDYTKLKIIFLDLMQTLGYDETKVITPGFIYKSETLFDICFKTDTYNDSSDLIYLSYVDYGADITNSIEKVNSAIVYNANLEDTKIKYYLISNGTFIKVYSNKPIGSVMTNVQDVGIIDMRNLKDKINILKLFDISENKTENNDDYDLIDDKINENKDKNICENKEKQIINKEFINNKLSEIINIFKNSNMDILKKIGLISLAIIFILFIFKFLFFSDNNQNDNLKETNVENISNESKQTNKINLNKDLKKENDVNYLNIKAVLDLNVSKTEELNIKLISDLPENTVIKVGIFCGEYSEYLYLKTDKDGISYSKFNIPSTWSDEKILVGAYLKFTEKGYTQPKNVIQKYGANGENINWNKEYPEDMITFSEITHMNELVKVLLGENKKNENEKLINTIKKDFSGIDTRIDSFGNIKHIPKNFSFDESNINESRNIYPMIFYDKKNNTSYLYIVCGYVGTQFLRFEKISFSCDGYNWSYENSTNENKTKIVGNKKSEWIYFNNVSNSALIGDMQVLSSSKDSNMYLTGSINKTFNISNEQKNDIKNFLYIYDTYYGNGTKVPDTSWFSLPQNKISLSYIVSPDKIYERGYKEINSLKKYNEQLNTNKINGISITNEEQELLDTMNITFRVTSDTIKTKIMDMINNSEATLINYDDYESNKKYMKLYFKYLNNGENIENGYIPYINIYDDFSVIVPIKTITKNTVETENVYAKFYINESLYNEIKTYFESLKYIKINN